VADTSSTITLNFDGDLSGLTRAAAGVRTVLSGITKGLAGIGAAGSGVTAVAGLVAALQQLAPAALLGAAAIGAFVAVKATFALATQGFAEAVGGDAEAMAKLAPAAREAAQAITALRDGPIRELQQSVQQAFFQGFAEDIGQLSGTFLPTLRTGLTGIGEALATVRRDTVRAFATPETAADLGNLLANTKAALLENTTFLGNFGAGFVQLGSIGSEFLPGLVSGLDGVAARFRDFVEDNPAAIHDMISNALQGFGDLFTGVGNIAASFGSILRGLAGDVGSPLAAFAELTGRLREFFASAAAQGPLQALGETLRTVSSVMGDVLLAALSAVGPLIQGLAPFVTALAQAFGDFATGALGALSGPLSQVVTQLGRELAPILPVVSAALVGVAEAIAPVINALAGPLASIISTIVLTLAQMVAAIAPVIAALGPLVSILGTTLADALNLVAPLLVEVAVVVAETLTTAISALVPLLPPLAAAFLSIIEAVVPLIPPLLDLAVATLPLFIGALQLVLPAVTAVVQIIAVLVAALVPLITSVVETTTTIVRSFSEMVGTVLSTIGGWITDMINFFTNLSQNGQQIVDDFTGAVSDFFAEMGDAVSDTANAIVALVTSQFGEMGASVQRFVGDMVAAVLRFFTNMRTDAVGAARALVTEAVAAIGRLASDFAAAAGRAVDGLVNGIRAGLGRVGDAARSLAQGAFDALNAVFNFGSPSKVTTQLGRWVGEGLALGIDGSTGDIIASARAAAQAANNALATGILPELAATAATVASSPGSADRARAGDAAAITAALGSSEVVVQVMLDGEPVQAIVRTAIKANESDTVRRSRVGTGVSF
jgi:phage-related protein